MYWKVNLVITACYIIFLFPDIHNASLNAKSLASDGQFLYLYTSKGLLKIGSGYGGTIKGHVYLHKADFHVDDRGWLGYANVRNSCLCYSLTCYMFFCDLWDGFGGVLYWYVRCEWHSSKLLGTKCLRKTIIFLTFATNVIESFILRFLKVRWRWVYCSQCSEYCTGCVTEESLSDSQQRKRLFVFCEAALWPTHSTNQWLPGPFAQAQGYSALKLSIHQLM